ncbi:N-acetyltransferase family protein [Micromonospora sp. BQ11]|uniref:GNAT family N-acetyltransferase n=1 Tax=Micromonospora sp. BQ11 TaxID=3452212 RepID=UPI003F8A6E65
MLTYTAIASTAAGQLFDVLGDLYGLVYAEPPYNEGPEEVARFRDGLPKEATRPGFSLIVAEDDGLLVGAAYGWRMPAGSWWSRADRDPPSEVRDADKFAVMEWIVHPQRRRAGIGAELMRRLLAGRTEPYATLASNPASTARAVYERAGWKQVATSVLPWGPSMDILVLSLPVGGK